MKIRGAAWWRRWWSSVRLFVLAILVGILVGAAADAFRWLLPHANRLFFGTLHTTDIDLTTSGYSLHHPYILVLPALGGLLVGLFLQFVAPQARGHGVAEVLAAVETRGSRIPPQVGAYTAIASSITIGSGGSAGPEGPAIQIGAALASGIGQWFGLTPDELRTLLACGGGTGLAALYNAPLAGTLFAGEVLLEDIQPRRLALVALAAVSGHYVATHLIINESLVSSSSFVQQAWQGLPLDLGLGLLAGPLGVVFLRLTHLVAERAGRLPVPAWLRPALGGLLVGLIGLLVPRILGTGEGTIQDILRGSIPLGLLFALVVLKLIATALTLGSGGAGGVFTPSLFMGVALGAAYGSLARLAVPGIAGPSTYALIGMGTVIASAVNAPLTAIVIVVELTGDFALLPGVVMAVAASTLVARALSSESIYTLPLLLSGIQRAPRAPNPLAGVRAGRILSRNWPVADPDEPIANLIARVGDHGASMIPLVDGSARLAGLLNAADLAQAAGHSDEESDLGRRARDFLQPASIVAYPDETLHEVLLRPGAAELPIIPVLSRDAQRYLGVIERQAMLRIYSRQTGITHPSEP